MDRPLREHIASLEERLQRLNAAIMENQTSRAERNRIEAEIRAVNLALTHFRSAVELERQLQQP